MDGYWMYLNLVNIKIRFIVLIMEIYSINLHVIQRETTRKTRFFKRTFWSCDKSKEAHINFRGLHLSYKFVCLDTISLPDDDQRMIETCSFLIRKYYQI